MDCIHCEGHCIKKGLQKNGAQKYRCKSCMRYQQQTYRNKAWLPHINRDIARFLRESVCIRGIGRLADISVQTVISRIKKMAQSIKEPPLSKGKTYEVDELRTYIDHKGRLAWVVLAYERETKRIVRFSVGARTNKTLKTVLDSLISRTLRKLYFRSTEGKRLSLNTIQCALASQPVGTKFRRLESNFRASGCFFRLRH